MNRLKFLKFITIFLVSCLLCGIANGQIRRINEANAEILKDVDFMKTSGINRYCIYRYDVIDGQVESDSVLFSEKTYDKDNRIFIDADYSVDFAKREIKLDLAGNIVNQTIYNKIGEISSNLVYEYDASGRIKIKKYYFGKSMAFKEIYDYERNIPSKITVLNPDGKTQSKTLFESDGNGNITKEIKYNNSNTVEFIYEYVYDKKGNCIEEKLFLGSDDLVSTSRISIDSNNRISEKSSYSRFIILLANELYEYFNNGNYKSIIKTGSGDKLLFSKTFMQEGDFNIECRVIDKDNQEEYLLKYFYSTE